jgi:DNA-directed RNA polymerase subunit beta'
MLLNKTVNKKILETIVHETFSNFGTVSSSSLLDSLKLLGFHYATNAGISISIEDLKTPDVKRSFIETANTEITFISQQWQKGFVSDTERFQSIIDSWNVATDSLKNRIVDLNTNKILSSGELININDLFNITIDDLYKNKLSLMV